MKKRARHSGGDARGRVLAFADPYFNGKLDDFRIANRALTPAEVYALATVPPLLGDYNRNNVVDLADYTVWRDNLGSAVLPYHSADGNGDGRIALDDHLVWKSRFGQRAASPAAAAMVESAATSSTSLALDWAYFDLADVKGDFLTLPALLNEPPLDEQVALLPPLLGAVTMNWSDSVCEAKDELLDASEDLSGEERFEPEMLLRGAFTLVRNYLSRVHHSPGVARGVRGRC